MKKTLFFCLLFLSFNLFASPPLRCEIQAALTDGKHACVSMLYAFEADHVDIKHLSGKNYTLAFKRVSTLYTYFSDRPNRIVGSNRMAKLPLHWSTGSDSFSAIPPNAIVEGFSDKFSKQDNFVFELMNPQYNEKKDMLMFNAVLVGNQAIQHTRVALNDVSVFIDGYWNPGGGF